MLRITEFVASNDELLLDADGDSSDWVEIYNSGPTAVDLTGLHLTDNAANKTTWTFPAEQSITAGGYLVVFASNKNSIRGNGDLHTNFAISADGESLCLVAEDGVTIIDYYAPKSSPPQVEDVSYGRATQPAGASTTPIAKVARSARQFVTCAHRIRVTLEGAKAGADMARSPSGEAGHKP